jgi:hypothetical protein
LANEAAVSNGRATEALGSGRRLQRVVQQPGDDRAEVS